MAWSVAEHSLVTAPDQPISQFAEALPQWAVALLALSYTAGLLLMVAVLAALGWHRRWDALRDTVLAGTGAGAMALAYMAWQGTLWPVLFSELASGAVRPQFPVVRVAVVTAVLVAAGPWLARPVRRLGWLTVAIVSGAAVGLALGSPSAAIAGAGLGLACGGGVLLVVGSPRGYPDVVAVQDALSQLGLAVPDLRLDPDQSWGVRRLIGTTDTGTDVEVKAYGRDATDSQVIAKLWRAALYRGGSARPMLSRLQSVEHEALVTLLARQAGLSAPRVLAAASATDEVAVLVTDRSGGPLAKSGAPLDDDELVDLWRQVARLHDAGMTHGRLTADSIRVTPEGLQLTDFGAGSVVFRQSDAALDVVHGLVATAQHVGAERAVAAAVAGLGAGPVADVVGYLQAPALTQTERRALPKGGARRLLGELRSCGSAATGTEPPEPVRLRRFGLRQLITIVLVLLFVSALVPLLTGVDYAQLWAALAGASWWLVVLALLACQVAFLPQATAMMSAVGRAIPLRPMTILQPAVAFISFAVPGVAGRVTMESAFLHKYGVPPTVSVTKGAIDAFSGFLVQVVLLVLAVLTGSIILVPSGSDDGSSVSWAVIALVVVLAAATVLAIWKVPKLHARVVPEVARGWQALTEVLASPRRALGLLGSNLTVQLLWGAALWLALEALGHQLSMISCLAVVVATSLLQGIVPVPGGIGVSEAVMSAFLVPLGVPAEVALGGAVIWRVATFYLPAIEGFFAARYLQRRGYL